MNPKIFILVLNLYMAGSRGVLGFSFITDFIANPLGALSETLFKFNPFKAVTESDHPLKVLVSNFDDFDLIGQTTKHNFPYGCNCRNYQCRCCSHIESGLMELKKQGHKKFLNFIKTKCRFNTQRFKSSIFRSNFIA
jgi:hypothetical protein